MRATAACGGRATVVDPARRVRPTLSGATPQILKRPEAVPSGGGADRHPVARPAAEPMHAVVRSSRRRRYRPVTPRRGFFRAANGRRKRRAGPLLAGSPDHFDFSPTTRPLLHPLICTLRPSVSRDGAVVGGREDAVPSAR